MRTSSPLAKRRGRRAKFRKPRFLSLSRELASTPSPQIAVPSQQPKPTSKPQSADRRRHKGTIVTIDPIVPDQRLDLYPLHSEDQQLQEEDDRHAAAFFDPDDYGTDTITSLLGAVKRPDPDDSEAAEDSFSVPGAPQHVLSPASSSPRSYGAASATSRDLARSVLRGRERWVLCQQQQEEDQGSSCAGDRSSWWAATTPAPSKRTERTQLCFLKLDYNDVLSSWSGARSVYVEGEPPQVVPDHYHHSYLMEQPSVFVELQGGGGGSSGTAGSGSCGSNLWVVPENSCVGGGREARVLRYREKRHNRLFAKRIRYEVRKLNAQKRPRIKGRFVKRTQEQELP